MLKIHHCIGSENIPVAWRSGPSKHDTIIKGVEGTEISVSGKVMKIEQTHS